MTGILAGKRAYVTGGSSGIGAEIVRTFAAQGARVAIGASSHAAQAGETAKSLPAAGEPHIVVQADFYDKSQTEQAADAVLEGLGGLDIFVHSAGIDVTETAPTHRTTDEVWDKMMTLHLTAAFRLSKRLIPALLQGRDPAIIFIGSVCGLVAWEGDVAYNVAKAGLQHLARCIASDYAKSGLRANVIAPGVIDTPLQIMYTDTANLLGMTYVYLPLMVLPLYASIEKLDFRLVEAGYDLYASRLQVLRRIVIPLVKPGIIAGSILVFIPSLGAYVIPRVLGGDGISDKARAKLGKPGAWQTHYVEPSAKPLEQWFGGLVSSRASLSLLRASGVGEALLLQHVASQAAAPLRFVDNALKHRGNARVMPLAHCFCNAQ